MLKHTGWSIHFDKCLGCGTTTKKHAGKGYCVTCYDKVNPTYIIQKKARNLQREGLYKAHLAIEEAQKARLPLTKLQYAKAYYVQHSSEYKERAKKRVKETKRINTQKLAEYLNEHPCVDCGETDIIVLHFDHIKGEKKYGIGDHMSLKWETLLKEIEKCVVRCANCHMRRTAIQQNWTKLEYSQKNFGDLTKKTVTFSTAGD